MILFLQILILFLIIGVYLSTTRAAQSSDWVRALVLAVAIALLSYLPIYLTPYLGFASGLIPFIVAWGLIMKILGKTMGGAFIFLLVIGLVQYIVNLGLVKYL